MTITYDPEKSRRNVEERGLSFELARDFQWEDALIVRDERQDYGEDRFFAIGYIADRLHVLVFSPRQTGVRVISLRKANDREQKRYADCKA